MKTPMNRARRLVAAEKDWSDADVQTRWESRITYWREVLLGEGRGSWTRMLDFSRPDLTAIENAMAADSGDVAWAAHMRNRKLFSPLLKNSYSLQRLLAEMEGLGSYNEDGSFTMSLARDMVGGNISVSSLEPVRIDPGEDYDWMIQHPQDRLFQISHQNLWHLAKLALAHMQSPDDRQWAAAWKWATVSHIAQCPELPEGHNDFGSGDQPSKPSNTAWSSWGYTSVRLWQLANAYVAMKESPELPDRFHAVVLRMIHAHARHLDALGSKAYSHNYLSSTGKGMFFAAALFPELKQGRGWLDRMWPRLYDGLKREILPDGCHMHRSLSYHLTFVQRPLGMIAVAERTERLAEIPEDFLDMTRSAVDAFARVITPIGSTPGINDDWTAATSYHHILEQAGRAFQNDEWLYVGTRGRKGKEPERLSWLLPSAQVLAMRSDWTPQATYLFFNVSPDGGHHHPDTLSVQLWSGGRHLLIDPGVGHYYTGEREISRRSWWHNCPTLGRTQLPDNPVPELLYWESQEDLDYALGRISFSGLAIRRHVLFVSRRFVVLWDEFQNPPKGKSIWENFHVGVPPGRLEVSPDGKKVQLQSAEGSGLLLSIDSSGWTVSRENGSQWLKYGGKPIETAIVHYQADTARAAMGFRAMLVPFRGTRAPRAVLNEIEPQADGTLSLTVTIDGRRRTLTTRARDEKH